MVNSQQIPRWIGKASTVLVLVVVVMVTVQDAASAGL